MSWSWIDDSHRFRSMSIGRPIPEIELFQTLTLKLQSQGHVCVQRARSYSKPISYQLTSFSFHTNQTTHSWDTDISKFDLEASKVKVMSDAKGQGHILYPVSNRCTSFSFHLNQTNHSWDMAKTVFDIEQGKSEGFDSCDRPSNLKLYSNRQFFRPCDREIWWMISKNNRALLLYYRKLCASFQIHWWIQTGFTVQKRSIWVEIGDMLSRVTLKFDGWPWNTIGHLFYTTSSFVHHFVRISEFKLKLQSGNP